MPDIVMPKLSDSMEQGTILTWLKASGDTVEVGDEILEIETDKSTVTYVAEQSGQLETLLDEGDTAAVGETIARIVAAEGVPAGQETGRPASRVPLPSPVRPSAPIPMRAAAHDRNGDGRAVATPLARRVAAVHGVDLASVAGTGPMGRITRGDVLQSLGVASDAAVAAAPPPAATSPVAAPFAAAPNAAARQASGSTRQELSRLQKLIARRMVEAKSTVPHFQVQTDVAMDAVLALRGQFKGLATEADVVPSINDVIIKAAAAALRQHPLANGSYQDDAFVLHEEINVGMAVAAEDALIVPTVFDAASKSLGQIARETRRLAQRVREGQITPAELESGTFTVSNLGMFGMSAIFPVINAPQAAILGVGASRPVLARVAGEIVEQSVITLTLSCDHRILYGADAARFLAEIRSLLETPMRLAL